MQPGPDMATSATLLGRLRARPFDQAAWDEFVERYGPRIYAWCRGWHLQEADAEDVTQDVLVRLAQKMQSFIYDPKASFRAWLKTLTHHAWCDYLTVRKARGDHRVLGDHHLDAVVAGRDLGDRLEEVFDQELLDEALARVRPRVQPHTWEAFRLLVLEGLSGAAVAARLNMKVATVFVVAGRVRRMVREEIVRLEGTG